MKRKIILIILFSIMVSISETAAQELNVAYQDSANFPYQLGNGPTIDWSRPGVAVELIKAVGNELNLKINFTRIPWKRCLSEMKHGKFDGVFNASFKLNRLEFGAYPTKNGKIDPTRRSYANSYNLFVLKNSPLEWDGKTISNLKQKDMIGAPLGYSIVDDLKKMGITVHEMKHTYFSFEMVIRGSLVGVAELNLAGDSYLKKFPEEFKNIVKVSLPLATKNYYLMLSHQFAKQHPELADTIWNTLASIRQSETFQRIIDRYYE